MREVANRTGLRSGQYRQSMRNRQAHSPIAKNYRAESYQKDLSLTRSLRNKIRRKRQLQKRLVMCFLTLVLITILSSFSFGFRTKAQESNEDAAYKYYKSITVEDGDTLWNYARQYGDLRYYDDCNDYIKEVKSINSLQNDKITAGCHLILPYYGTPN